MWSEKLTCDKCGDELIREQGATYCWNCDVKPKNVNNFETAMAKSAIESQDALNECIEETTKRTKACMDYLSIIDLYSRRIYGAKTLDEAKDWANKMTQHALQVK